MTSDRQFEANRRNARYSSGPKTLQGKLRSRRNAVRHGLTAETVIGVLEDPKDYKSFETAIIADYAPKTVVEHELVSRLASLLWRLRRATSVETGLLQIQAKILQEREKSSVIPLQDSDQPPSIVYRMFGEKDRSGVHAYTAINSRTDRTSGEDEIENCGSSNCISETTDSTYVALCFLRFANIERDLLERIGRYESTLWRQTRQLLLMLEETKHRSPFVR